MIKIESGEVIVGDSDAQSTGENYLFGDKEKKPKAFSKDTVFQFYKLKSVSSHFISQLACG